MASKIDDAVLLARVGGGVIVHTKQVLAVYPSGQTKILQAFSWNAKEDEFVVKKKVKPKKEIKEFSVSATEAEI